MKESENLPVYHPFRCDTKKRFISYWHQIDEVRKTGAHFILEVGIGTGFVSGYLRQGGLVVTTVDVDPDRKPEIVANVVSLPFAEGIFTTVLCCEVLEHLDFSQFASALSELSRVSREWVVISLPDVSLAWKVDVQLPIIGTVQRLIPRPTMGKPEKVFSPGHKWEIGMKNYPLARIAADINRMGLEITGTYRILEYSYHRVFTLRKGSRWGNSRASQT